MPPHSAYQNCITGNKVWVCQQFDNILEKKIIISAGNAAQEQEALHPNVLCGWGFSFKL